MKSNAPRKGFAWLLIITFFSILTGIAAGGIFALMHDLPQIRALENFRPSAVTRVYTADGTMITEFYTQNRVLVPIGQIPANLVNALITTEDRNFFSHSGVDLKGIIRAAVADIRAGEFVEGASTITQQLAKTLFLDPRKTIVRKIREAILAVQLERRYTKHEILELYLNQVYFGSGAYGVESAAQFFFGKPVQKLTLAECALVAAMPKAPSRFSPLVNPKLAENRRNLVLRQMRDTGIISLPAYQKSVSEPLRLGEPVMPKSRAPYFTAYIRGFLEEKIGAAQLYRGGLRIQTTLEDSLQEHAEHAVLRGLSELDQRMKKNLDVPPGTAQSGLVALDVNTGGILAMVGGRDYSQSQFNRAVQALRQPGSAFKPIVYATALEQGFSQNRTLLDAPVIFRGAQNGTDWQPENFSHSYLGTITLRKALAQSQNIPAVRLIEMLGPSSVVDFAKRMGILSRLRPNLSLALGTSEVTLLELTASYAVFANRGEQINPYGVLSVTDATGRAIWSHTPKKSIVMSRQGAAIITDMLQAVIQEGTGRKARSIHRPLAGKTGTTNDFADALFVGYSPAIACGVWVGRDIRAPLGPNETGAKAALPIWIHFMENALSNRPYRYFDIPDDVTQAYMDPVTGHLLAKDSPDAVRAMFRGKSPVFAPSGRP